MTYTARIESGGGQFWLPNVNGVQWSSMLGTVPVQRPFDMRIDDAVQVIDAGGEIDLIFDDGAGTVLKFSRLSPLYLLPSEHPDLAQVMISDIRWTWQYQHIYRRYNIRRKAGVRRRLDWIRDEFEPVIDDIKYAAWSLVNETTPWTARDVLSDIMQQVNQDPIVLSNTSEILSSNIDEMILDETVESALQRVMTKIPGLNLFINADGRVVFTSEYDYDSETKMIKAGEPHVIAGGIPMLSRRDNVRPRAIEVLFSVETELRFDFIKDDTATTTNTRLFENVMPIPDPSLVVDGKELPQGTWITIDQAIEAYNAEGGQGKFTTINHDFLEKAFIPDIDTWAGLELEGSFEANADVVNWAARIAAFKEHYRTTFRVPREWQDRIYTLKAERIGTIDTVSGTRAPATCYANYAFKGSQKAYLSSLAKDENMYYATNVDCYPQGTGDPPAIDSTTLVAPAQVSILDEPQGIIHIEWAIDRYYNAEMVFPSRLINIPQYSYGNIAGTAGSGVGSVLTWNAVEESEQSTAGLPKLASTHSAAIVLTATPASPNSNNVLYKYSISPQDIANKLPPHMRDDLNHANGPVLQLRISPDIETARYAWSDAFSASFDKLYGVDDLGGEFKIAEIESLLINGGGGDAVAASLEEIAKAFASVAYATYADRYAGGFTSQMQPFTPVGAASEIVHRIVGQSPPLTSVMFSPELVRFDPMTLLPESVRRIVTRSIR